MKTRYLIYSANQMTGFYMKCKAGLKRDNLILCKAVVVEEALFKNLVVGGNGVHWGRGGRGGTFHLESFRSF